MMENFKLEISIDYTYKTYFIIYLQKKNIPFIGIKNPSTIEVEFSLIDFLDTVKHLSNKFDFDYVMFSDSLLLMFELENRIKILLTIKDGIENLNNPVFISIGKK